MDDDESKPHIIIDNGNGYTKVGFSSEEMPKTVI